MHEERSCFSSDVIIALEGQTTHLPTYALQDGDSAVLDAGAYGPCYLSELAASPWGGFWSDRISRHSAMLGRHQLAQDGGWTGWLFPNTPELELIHTDGTMFTIRLDQPRQESSQGVLIQQRPWEHTLRLGGEHQHILEEVRHRVRDQGEFPLLELFDALRLTHRLRDTASLADGAFRFDEELYEYWAETAITGRMAYATLIPKEAASLLSAADATLKRICNTRS